MKHYAGRRELSQQDFNCVQDVLRAAYGHLALRLKEAEGLVLPGLKNMNAGAALGDILLSQPLLGDEALDPGELDGQWIGKLLNQLGEDLDKCARIHFKRLGGILMLQERIAERWQGRMPTF